MLTHSDRMREDAQHPSRFSHHGSRTPTLLPWIATFPESMVNGKTGFEAKTCTSRNGCRMKAASKNRWGWRHSSEGRVWRGCDECGTSWMALRNVPPCADTLAPSYRPLRIEHPPQRCHSTLRRYFCERLGQCPLHDACESFPRTCGRGPDSPSSIQGCFSSSTNRDITSGAPPPSPHKPHAIHQRRSQHNASVSFSRPTSQEGPCPFVRNHRAE